MSRRSFWINLNFKLCREFKVFPRNAMHFGDSPRRPNIKAAGALHSQMRSLFSGLEKSIKAFRLVNMRLMTLIRKENRQQSWKLQVWESQVVVNNRLNGLELKPWNEDVSWITPLVRSLLIDWQKINVEVSMKRFVGDSMDAKLLLKHKIFWIEL